MAAQGIYVLKPILDEKVFDNLCETLEEYGVDIVAPVIFDFVIAKTSETELVISGTEEVLEDLKEELDSNDMLDTVSIVDSFENQFDEESGEEVYEDDGL